MLEEHDALHFQRLITSEDLIIFTPNNIHTVQGAGPSVHDSRARE
jgi:hypothetical protein